MAHVYKIQGNIEYIENPKDLIDVVNKYAPNIQGLDEAIEAFVKDVTSDFEEEKAYLEYQIEDLEYELDHLKELNNFIDKHQREIKVFCKDCEHMESIADISQFCNKFGGYVTDDDYCSRGKIREE